MNNSLQTQEGFSRPLIRWYRFHLRPLPWRNTKKPYPIWISEIMLQQTTVQSVLPYFEKWLAIFPDLPTLSRAPLQKVLKTWQGLGYYQRARNLHAAAKIIMRDHQGTIPDTYQELIQLPGFGPYTTAAVLSLAFDKPYPVLETNVRRVLMRLFALNREADARYDKTLLKFLNPLLPKTGMGVFNQAMMELGALVCRPKNPSCLLCPIDSHCKAFSMGIQEILPKPRRRNYRKIDAVIGIIHKGNKFLMQKRPSKGLLANLWEFPGGKTLAGENLRQALQREIKEELDSTVKSLKYLTCVQHSYTQYQVTLHAFDCQLKDIPVLKKRSRRWITLEGMYRYPLPSGSAKIVKFLEARRNKEKTLDETKSR